MSYEETAAITTAIPTLSLEECDETFTKGVLLIKDAVLNYAQHGLTAGQIGQRVRDLGGKAGDSTIARWIAGFKAEKLLPEKELSERTERRHKQQERERSNSHTEKMAGAIDEADVIDVTPATPLQAKLENQIADLQVEVEAVKLERDEKVAELQKQLKSEQHFHQHTRHQRKTAENLRDDMHREQAPLWREVHSLRKQLAEATAQLETQVEVAPDGDAADQSQKIERLQKRLKERDRKIVKLKALIPKGVTNLPNIELEPWEETDEERLRQYPTSHQASVAKWKRENEFVAAEPLGELLGELRGRVIGSIGAYSTDEVQRIARSLRWLAHSVQEEFLDRGKPGTESTTSPLAQSTLRRTSGDVIDI